MAKAKVLVSDKLSDAGLAQLRHHADLTVEYAPGLKEDELAARIADFDALVIRSGSKVSAKVVAAAQKLRVIGRAGIGVDNVDVSAASKRGIVVMNTPTGNAVTTAEHAIALMMSLARNVPQATASMKEGKWEKMKFQGRELAGKTIGVLGLGNIGRIVADRAKGLKMHVIGYDPVLSEERAQALGIELVTVADIFERSDVITAHTPLTAETKGIVNDAAIAKMKKGVLLVNCCRGGVYDEGALLRGLESGKLGGVALDVFVEEPAPKDHPLVGRPDVITTPHLGASTEEAQERVAVEIAAQVAAYLMHGTIVNAVNAPSVDADVVPKLRPWIELSRKLGDFIAQVGRVRASVVEVETIGEPSHLGPTAITRNATAAFLTRFVEAVINDVSAPSAAEDRGIEIKEVRRDRSAGSGARANSVVVRVHAADGTRATAEGTVGHTGAPRLVRFGDYELDAGLSEHSLLLFNDDKPGVVGAVGTILGARGINVAQVHLGAHPETRRVLSVWSVEAPVPADVIAEIKRAAHVTDAMPLELP